MHKQHEDCPITYAMKVIGGKWKPIIFMRLTQGVNRFGVLSRSINGISKNMLTRELRELESHKIINRKIFPEIPPRVEYSLTRKGQTLIPVFEKLTEWGELNKSDG